MKFGGTSVGDAERIKTVAEIVKSQIDRDPVVVVSAFSGVTDGLIRLANDAVNKNSSLEEIRNRHFDVMKDLGLDASLIRHELEELEIIIRGISLLKELTPRSLDLAISFGERMSSKILAAYMSKLGLDAKPYNAYDIGFVTDSNFGNAEILEETETNIREFFNNVKSPVTVVAGFIAKDKQGEITTLGRGGSDYTASVIGAALDAEEVQIWTDADGIMTADPKIVKGAKTIDYVSYDEASELAFLGAKVLHPKTILPAVKKNIPVKTLNTYNPTHRGTTILEKVDKQSGIISIASKKNIKVINIRSPKMFLAYGFIARIFDIFANLRIPVDLVSTSEVNISVTIDGKYDTERLVEELRRLGDVEIRNNRASISVVATRLASTPGIAGKVFSSLGDNKINVEMISSGASKINESFVVKEEDADDAVRILHEAFFGE
ncbi:MAG: aspartate kinase [Candidatus Aenigmarchaeota archaeon]|nr:aspartate kinase [Candidatus Aenigmarchaeota archaeon]